jgi:ABC-type xylose transport system permease subunit
MKRWKTALAVGTIHRLLRPGDHSCRCAGQDLPLRHGLAHVGGCLLAGGRISVIGALAGAFILSGIQSYLVVMSVSPQFYLMVLAGLVIAALLGDNQFRAWALRRR